MPRFATLLVAAAVCALVACSSKTPADYIKSAEKQIAERNFRGAEVELLNAVRLAPDSGTAHRLRGVNRLSLGLAAAAEADLRRALQLKEPADSILPSLAQALALQGKSAQLLGEFAAQPRLASATAEAELRTAVGDAHLAQRDAEQARKSYQEALAAVAGHVQARLGLARAAAAMRDSDTALAMLEAVIADAPGEAEAHFVKAMVLGLRADRAGTQRALEQALQASPEHAKARVELATLLIEAQQYDRAATVLSPQALALAGARDGRLVFLRALLDARRGALADARKQVSEMLAKQPDNVNANVLAAEVELGSRNSMLAETHLRRALAVDRNHRGAKLMLAAVQLQQAAPAKAIETLQPLLADAAQPERKLLVLAGEAHLMNGELGRAAELFEASRAGRGDDAQVLLRLGQIAVAQGDFDGGAKALQEAADLDHGEVQAGAELVALHLYRGEAKKAVQAAEALKTKLPKNWLAQVLAGQARLAAGDLAGARSAFDAALALKPNAHVALAGLAEIDLAEGRIAQAVRRYESALAQRPDEQLFLALAAYQRRTSSRADDAPDTLRKAIAALPNSVPLHRALASIHLERRDAKSALALMNKLAGSHPGESAVLEALADVQLLAAPDQELATTLARLATLEPQGPRPLQHLAGLQLARKDAAGAIATLKRAQALATSDLSVAADLARAQMAAGAFDRAAEVARTIQARAPQRALGLVLQGDIHAAQRQGTEAARAYRSALQVEPRHTPAALKLCRVLNQARRSAECAEFANHWLAANPGDTAMRLQVGDDAAAQGRFGDAARQYQAIIAREPTHAAALNNLAWVLGQLHDPRAMGFAQRAVRLAPNDPDVLNTLGVLQLGAGQPQEGLSHLAAARTMAPARLDLRLHHAKGLLQVNRIDEARTELLALAAEPADFQGKQELAPLLKQLPARP